MTHAHYPARYSAHVPPALAELIAAIRWTADPKSGRLGMTLAQEEVELLARHLLLPANENALDRSIAAVDQFMDSDDSHVLMPEHGEAILLILHELEAPPRIKFAIFLPGPLLMACQRVQLPGGAAAIVRGPRQPVRRCSCGAPAPLLCDWKVPGRNSGTCDRPVCESCATSPAPDKDLCVEHAAAWIRWQQARGLQA